MPAASGRWRRARPPRRLLARIRRLHLRRTDRAFRFVARKCEVRRSGRARRLTSDRNEAASSNTSPMARDPAGQPGSGASANGRSSAMACPRRPVRCAAVARTRADRRRRRSSQARTIGSRRRTRGPIDALCDDDQGRIPEHCPAHAPAAAPRRLAAAESRDPTVARRWPRPAPGGRWERPARVWQ